MAPNVTEAAVILEESFFTKSKQLILRRLSGSSLRQPPEEQTEPNEYKRQIVWRNVIAFVYLHYAAIYGFYLLGSAQWRTTLFSLFCAHLAGLGITAGAHRLWAHRSYKAAWPLRAFLMICQTMAFQNHLYEWVRDHRVHHKYTDTDADPHNSSRGFFFSHMGWLMVRKHPQVRQRGKGLDMADMEEDSVVMFQKKFYLPLVFLCCFAVPTWIPVYFWGEQLFISYYVTMARYTLQLHATWLVNSAAHIWGMKPYDTHISPTQNLAVAIVSLGEGWHNYHHVFPWDYKTAELGSYGTNFTAAFIDICAKLRLAYNLKSVPNHHIRMRAQRTGDGSHKPGKSIWGWGDEDALKDDIAAACVSHRKHPK